jgi:hypothetical protein
LKASAKEGDLRLRRQDAVKRRIKKKIKLSLYAMQ